MPNDVFTNCNSSPCAQGSSYFTGDRLFDSYADAFVSTAEMFNEADSYWNSRDLKISNLMLLE